MEDVGTWHKKGSRAKHLLDDLERIFHETLDSKISIQLHFIPSRRLSWNDECLSPFAWGRVQYLLGGQRGYSVDLMALPSNVYPELFKNPYVFPPVPLVGQVLRFLWLFANIQSWLVAAYALQNFALRETNKPYWHHQFRTSKSIPPLGIGAFFDCSDIVIIS